MPTWHMIYRDWVNIMSVFVRFSRLCRSKSQVLSKSIHRSHGRYFEKRIKWYKGIIGIKKDVKYYADLKECVNLRRR